MRLWIDVLSGAGVRLGDGPITTATSAAVTRSLDGAGSISFSVPGTDERALALVLNERRARIYVNDGYETRELGRGIIRKISARDSAAGWSLSPDGPDSLDELKRISTLLGRKYDDETVTDVATDLLALAGWTLSGGSATNISARFDGESVLRALQTVAEHQGLHLREGASAGELEIGAFGVDVGLRLMQTGRVTEELEANDTVVFIERFSLVQDSEAVCNWILPLMAGMGESAPGLELSTRTIPYTIHTTTMPNGQVRGYIRDDTSIATYNTIQKVSVFKQIAPLSNSPTSLELAANSLYDAAVSYLQRHKDPQQTYSVTCRKVRGVTVRPGDKIHVRYKGVVENDAGEIVTYRDINDDFWVIEARERIGLEGLTLDLKISNIDRHETDIASLIIGKLDEIEIGNTRVEPYFSRDGFVAKFEIDPTHKAKFYLDYTDAVQKVTRVKLKLKTRPFRATVAGAAGGGATVATTSATAHDHALANTPETPSVGPYYNRGFTFRTSDDDLVSVVLPVSEESALFALATAVDGAHDHDVTLDDHFHDLDYGIHDDTEYPDTVSIEINGNDVTGALGGPWAVGGGAVDEVLDITSIIEAETGGGVNMEHSIEISCADGQGLVEIIVENYLVIQTIRVV